MPSAAWLIRESSSTRVDCDGKCHRYYEFNDAVLSEICKQAESEGAEQVAVISIVGIYREGKSFLLNFFLDYLYKLRAFQRMEHERTSSTSSLNRIEWVNKKGRVFEGFISARGQKPTHAHNGVERVTNGVWIWNEPIVIETKDGYRMAVLVIDTQGFLDKSRSIGDCASLFAFSTMICSLQIYNVMKMVNESHLQSLALFSEFGRGKTPAEIAPKSRKRSAFQDLVLVVRDFQFPESHQFGAKGGEEYLKTLLHHCSTIEGRGARLGVTDSFSTLGCVLLPHPGLAVSDNPLFDGDISQINEQFVSEVKQLVEGICGRETREGREEGRLQAKTSGDVPLTPAMFYKYVDKCVFALNDHSKELPKGLLAANHQMTCYAATERAKNGYRIEIARHMVLCQLSPLSFKDVHEKTAKKHLDQFLTAIEDVCSEEEKKIQAQRLEDYFNEEYEMLALGAQHCCSKKRVVVFQGRTWTDMWVSWARNTKVGLLLSLFTLLSILVAFSCVFFWGVAAVSPVVAGAVVVSVGFLVCWIYCRLLLWFNFCRRRRRDKRHTAEPIMRFV